MQYDATNQSMNGALLEFNETPFEDTTFTASGINFQKNQDFDEISKQLSTELLAQT